MCVKRLSCKEMAEIFNEEGSVVKAERKGKVFIK